MNTETREASTFPRGYKGYPTLDCRFAGNGVFTTQFKNVMPKMSQTDFYTFRSKYFSPIIIIKDNHTTRGLYSFISVYSAVRNMLFPCSTYVNYCGEEVWKS